VDMYFEDDGYGNMVASDGHGNNLELPSEEFLEQSNDENTSNDNNDMIITNDTNDKKLNNTILHQHNQSNENHCSQPLNYTSINNKNPSQIYKQFCYLKSDVHELKLLQILSAHNVPHDLHKDIVDWARAAYNEGYNFNPK